MKTNKEDRLNWRRLDNSAKIFPISAGERYSTVFRLSALLNEKIEPNILLNLDLNKNKPNNKHFH